MDDSNSHTHVDRTYEYINEYLNSPDSPLPLYDSYIDLTTITGKDNRKQHLENKLLYINECLQDRPVMVHFIGHAGSPSDKNGLPIDVIEDMRMDYIANIVHTYLCNYGRKVVVNLLGSCHSDIFKKYLKGAQLLCTNNKTNDIYSPFKVNDFIHEDGTIDFDNFKHACRHDVLYERIEC